MDTATRARVMLLLDETRSRGYNPAPGRQVFTAEGARKYGLPIGATILPGMRKLTAAQEASVADLPAPDRARYLAARRDGSTHAAAMKAARGSGAPSKATPAKKATPRKAAGYHVGFTGTRAGMTPDQKEQLRARLAAIKAEHGDAVFHHGQAVGSDEEAAVIARDLGFRVVSHPSNMAGQTSGRGDLNHETRPPKAPLSRNHDIVAESDVVLATPRTSDEQLRSGTWATIRHAKKTGVPVEQITPKATPAKKATPRKAAPKAPDLTGEHGLSSDPAVREVQVENRIRAAYREAIAAGDEGPYGRPSNGRIPKHGDMVMITGVRRRVGNDVSREEFDNVMKRLDRSGAAYVTPQEDQKRLTAADRIAGVPYGGDVSHMFSIADPSPRPLLTPAEKATPRKATPKGAPFDAGQASRRLGSASTREEANAALDGLTKPQLLEVARESGMTSVSTSLSRDAMKHRMIELAGAGRYDTQTTYLANMEAEGGFATLAPRTPGSVGPIRPREDFSVAQGTQEKLVQTYGRRAPDIADAPDLTGLTTRQKRARLKAMGFTPEQVDELAPTAAMAKKAAAKAPRGPRVSGLPTDRRPAAGDYEDLANRITGMSEAQKLEIFQDLNATELAGLARRFPGDAMLRPSLNMTSERTQGLKIPAGLSLDEKRRWLAKQLSQQTWHWRSAELDPDDIQRADDLEDEEDFDDDEAEDEPVDEMDLALEHYKPLDAATRSRALVMRAAGHDVTPGHDELHHYWTRGEGLAKWVGSPKPWTTLVAHLTKYVGPEKAKVFASRWFIEVFGFAAGSDLNRVTHGHPPRGHLVGPG